MKKLAILIRGHERTVFQDDRFYDLIKALEERYEIDIYIHSWNFSEAKLSWRALDPNPYPITEEMVRDYFKDLNGKIKKIIIDDDEQITLIGNTDGGINQGASQWCCPVISWKRMWYGQFRMIQYIHETNPGVRNDIQMRTHLPDGRRIPDSSPSYYDFVLNIRIDIFQNSNNVITKQRILDRVEEVMYRKENNTLECQIYFMFDELFCGVDNCFLGNVSDMHKLISRFHFELDVLLLTYPKTIYNQEFFVYFESFRLFGAPISPAYNKILGIPFGIRTRIQLPSVKPTPDVMVVENPPMIESTHPNVNYERANNLGICITGSICFVGLIVAVIFSCIV